MIEHGGPRIGPRVAGGDVLAADDAGVPTRGGQLGPAQHEVVQRREPQHGAGLSGTGIEEQGGGLVVPGNLPREDAVERQGGILLGELAEAALDALESLGSAHLEESLVAQEVSEPARSSRTMTSWCAVWGNMSNRRASRAV